MNFFDIHAHVQFSDFDADRKNVLARMRKENVTAIVVGTDLASSRAAVSLAEQEKNIFASVGVHPNSARDEAFDKKEFEKLAAREKVVAVGECGLDYFRTDATEENIALQKKLFLQQLELAIACDKPLMIHCRTGKYAMKEKNESAKNSPNSYEDIIEILFERKKNHGKKLRGNIHFFAGTAHIAEKFFELDFTISFTGVITLTDDYNEVIKRTPLEMMMAETDCPYVAPKFFRGKRSEPVHVRAVVKKIAELKSQEENVVADIFEQNVKRVFRVVAS